MSKIIVHIYTTDKTGYIINPSLHINKMFKIQGEKCLGYSFYIEKMQSIKNCLMNKNTSLMAFLMIYGTVGMSIKNLLRVLICVVYTLIDNYVCIEYLQC